MLERLGRFIYRWRWTVAGTWFVVCLGAAAFAPRVTGVLHSGGYTIGNSQSVAAYNALNRAYGYRALIFTAVFLRGSASAAQAVEAARAWRREGTARFGAQLRIDPPVWTPDHEAVFERIYSSPQADFGAHYANALRHMLPHGAVRGYLTGSSAIFYDMEQVSEQDVRRVELVTLPIAGVLLLLLFGSVVAAITPVLMAPITVTIALALIFFIGHRVDMSIFVLNVTSMVGLGFAIDYSLFMVYRFRAELAEGRDLETAIGRTVATAGRSILVSALVVTFGFYALTFSGVQMLRSLGIGSSLVTVLSLLVAVTLLPAVLGMLGHRINLFSVVPRRFTRRRIWHGIAHGVMRRPVLVIGLVTAIVAVLAAPAFHLRPGVPGSEILPASVNSRAGNDLLDRHLGYANRSPVLVVVEREAKTPPSTAESAAFVVLDRVCSSPEVVGLSTVPLVNSPRQIVSCSETLARLQSPAPASLARARQLARHQRVGLVAVYLRSDPSSAAAERYVSRLRHQPPIPGYRVLIGGETAGQMDFNAYLYSTFPLVALFVVVTSFLILLFAFRSIVLPLKAILMNVFSVLAAYGLIVFGFQDGHLSGLLSFTVVNNVDSTIPVLLFCALFGLSTDYEVFLLSRVQEAYLARGNNEESVATGLEATGRIITSAAVIMIVVFGAFAFAQLVVIKELGLGLAMAVLVDATLIRVLLVPAAMRLFGRWNWWLPFRGFPPLAAGAQDVSPGKPTAAG